MQSIFFWYTVLLTYDSKPHQQREKPAEDLTGFVLSSYCSDFFIQTLQSELSINYHREQGKCHLKKKKQPLTTIGQEMALSGLDTQIKRSFQEHALSVFYTPSSELGAGGDTKVVRTQSLSLQRFLRTWFLSLRKSIL